MGFLDWLSKLVSGKAAAPSPPPKSASLPNTPRTWSDSQTPAVPPQTNNVVTNLTSYDQLQRQRPTPPPAPKRENKRLAGLELGPFEPLSKEQMHSQANQLESSWRNRWFGRRDLIPPADDKRTELIDRGMVGAGLISPEELTEIHRVGDQMHELRPTRDRAHQLADQAVEQSKAEREANKQRKRAEAAARKSDRETRVRERKANDIIFLGRGVSRGLADCRGDLPKLMQLKLPLLSTPANVAAALGLSVPQLRWLAFHNDTAQRVHYITFQVAKKSGGVRRLSTPHARLKKCQRWILANILNKVPVHPSAHGFVPQRSIATNAAQHVGRAVVLNADLVDFFPTITFPRVKGAFRSLGYSPAVSTILALLCTESPRESVVFNGRSLHVAVAPRSLPQGAPTSPALSNLVSKRLDRRLSGIANKLGWTFTRYADDMTLSTGANATGGIGYVLARLRHITQDEGFAVNEAKTRVQRRHTRQSVTGVVVNEKLSVDRKLIRRVRAILHRAQREGLAAQNRNGHPNFTGWLAGTIAYIHMLNPEQGGRLRTAYAALFPAEG